MPKMHYELQRVGDSVLLTLEQGGRWAEMMLPLAAAAELGRHLRAAAEPDTADTLDLDRPR